MESVGIYTAVLPSGGHSFGPGAEIESCSHGWEGIYQWRYIGPLVKPGDQSMATGRAEIEKARHPQMTGLISVSVD